MTTTVAERRSDAEWVAIVRRYQGADVRRALLQLATTIGPLALLLALMYRSLALPYWTTLLLAVPTGGLLVRDFIIMHDCAHGSFLPWRRANDVVGWITGLLMLTPFAVWRHGHALHHASAGDLDRRGHGDVDTLTVREYLALSPWGRLRYRLMRNPLVLFGLGPVHFWIDNRVSFKGTAPRARQLASLWLTNAGLAAGVLAAAAWIGWRALLRVYLPPLYIATVVGIWLFYVQHQFEETCWDDHADWDFATAAIRGSSYLRLPRVLQWFTGSIGLHHVHHLGPRIPNYRLQRCHDENPLFHAVTVLTLRDTRLTFRLKLWDEDRRRLVGFDEVRVRSFPGAT